MKDADFKKIVTLIFELIKRHCTDEQFNKIVKDMELHKKMLENIAT